MLNVIIITLLIALFIGILLEVASRALYVPEDPRLQPVVEMLPGANCGQCGNPGCRAMAQALLDGNSKPTQCKPGTYEMAVAIKEYLENTPGPDGETVKVRI